MELRQLEHFIAVAEARHFTKAAGTLNISQSGLSASIRALESELGTELFLRSTRRVELTQAGQALFAESVRTIASAAAARDAVTAVKGVLSGTLSVGSEQCLGVCHLPAELATFRTRHPGVGVRLGFAGSARLLEDVAAGRIDVALIAECGLTPLGVTVRRVSSEPFTVLCSPSHPFAARRSLTLADIADETIVGFQSEWGAQVLVARALAGIGVSQRVELETNDVPSLLDLVEHGLGIAVVPEHFSQKRPSALASVPLDSPGLEWSVGIATAGVVSPAARAFLTQLDTTALAA
ncbi:LysR family transcriptional regulator [Humibacter sp. RRB41]|uniref:LysR family transcriptional regulator n=1 Tax=Humibacter sp. RRB41 TaxID=2919946 RepID=UPI001FA97EEE|nr:LysR family transcriptional regulator [Humibacter sp. RRB41]